MSDSILRSAIRRLVWLVVAIAWIAIGTFFFWPMLTRAIGVYTGLLVLSMIRPRPLSIGERELDRATRFWSDGFERVNSIVSERRGSAAVVLGPSGMDFLMLGFWSVGCLGFWLGIWALIW